MSSPANPRRSRIAHFRAPFIVSMAGAVSLGLACRGDVETDDPNECFPRGNLICNPPPWPPPPGCGTSPAQVGTSCAGSLGLTCSYDTCIGNVPTRQCAGGSEVWVDIPVAGCNPDVCPDALPVAGSDCTVPEVSCAYAGECALPSTAVCRAGQWLVALSSDGRCDPLSIVPVCPERQIVTGEDCVYEGPACIRGSCEPGIESYTGHVCSGTRWQAAVVFCAPDAGASDAGAPDAGASDGGVGDGGG